MNEIIIHDKTFVHYIGALEIGDAIRRVAAEITHDLGDRDPLFVCIMNGSFMFASELMQAIDGEYEVAFARYSSYQGTQSTFELKEVMPVTRSLEGRTVVIVEDLIDTGYTMMNVRKRFFELGAYEVYIAAMLLKPDALQCDVKTDYVGLEIANEFIVGHGLDFNDRGRMLRDIYRIKS